MNNKVAPVVGWISLALLASVAIWQFALSVSSTLDTSQAVSRMGFGLIVSLLTILLITVLCRYSKSKPDLKFFSHSKKFLVGAGWYIVPAVVGLVIASLFGVVEISINTSFGDGSKVYPWKACRWRIGFQGLSLESKVNSAKANITFLKTCF